VALKKLVEDQVARIDVLEIRKMELSQVDKLSAPGICQILSLISIDFASQLFSSSIGPSFPEASAPSFPEAITSRRYGLIEPQDINSLYLIDF